MMEKYEIKIQGESHNPIFLERIINQILNKNEIALLRTFKFYY